MSTSIHYQGKFVFDPADPRFKNETKDGLPCVTAYDSDGLNPVFTIANRPATDPSIPGYPNYAGSRTSIELHGGKGAVPGHVLSLSNEGHLLQCGVRISFDRMARHVRFSGLFSRGHIVYFNADHTMVTHPLEPKQTAIDETLSDEKGIRLIHFDFESDASLYLFELEMSDSKR